MKERTPSGVARRQRHPPALAWVALLGAALLAVAQPPAAQTLEAQTLEGAALVQALREGGFNLYFRHAATEWSQSDRISEPGDWESCDPASVRQLSDRGRDDARAVGDAMRRLGVPVGRVYASPYCRTVQTAELLGVGAVAPTVDVMNLRAADYVGGREAVVERARGRLATAPPPGSNDVYVAHGNVARAATAVYPGEGEALVFRPLGDDGFEFVGRLDPQTWRALAAEADD